MSAPMIGPDTDARADLGSLEWLHEHLGQEFPISGDDIARARVVTA